MDRIRSVVAQWVPPHAQAWLKELLLTVRSRLRVIWLRITDRFPWLLEFLNGRWQTLASDAFERIKDLLEYLLVPRMFVRVLLRHGLALFLLWTGTVVWKLAFRHRVLRLLGLVHRFVMRGSSRVQQQYELKEAMTSAASFNEWHAAAHELDRCVSASIASSPFFPHSALNRSSGLPCLWQCFGQAGLEGEPALAAVRLSAYQVRVRTACPAWDRSNCLPHMVVLCCLMKQERPACSA